MQPQAHFLILFFNNFPEKESVWFYFLSMHLSVPLLKHLLKAASAEYFLAFSWRQILFPDLCSGSFPRCQDLLSSRQVDLFSIFGLGQKALISFRYCLNSAIQVSVFLNKLFNCPSTFWCSSTYPTSGAILLINFREFNNHRSDWNYSCWGALQLRRPIKVSANFCD